MASFAEAMEWHTKRFLGNGSGSGVDAYPKLADDGSVKWYTFTDGKLTSSPMNSQPQATQQAKPSRFNRNRHARFQHSRPLYEPPVTDHVIDPPSREEIIGERICSLACDDVIDCPGAYRYSVEDGTAFCGNEPRFVKVTLATYEAASDIL